MAERAYTRLIAMLWDGELAAGQFVSMPRLVDLLGLPLAATREAVKRAEARDLVSVLPKRGVLVMTANPKAIRDCLDLRSILDEEGTRRLIEASATQPFDELRHSHRMVLEAARRDMHINLARRAMATDLSLHDVLATGLENPLAIEVYRVNRDRLAVIQNSRPLPPDRIVSAMEEHLAIIDALERRNIGAAVDGIRAHFRTTLRWWGILV
jgi:DNA-binding GntR family transcriptional regulator